MRGNLVQYPEIPRAEGLHGKLIAEIMVVDGPETCHVFDQIVVMIAYWARFSYTGLNILN